MVQSTNQVITFGCRLNTYESEVIKDVASKAGLDGAVVVNTCAVTAEAERQARQSIRKIKKKNPNAKIIVTGCSAQINPLQYANMPEVFKIIGNDDKTKVEAYQNFDYSPEDKVVVNDIMTVYETAAHMISGFEGKARAYVQIQNGCDHRCTFCIIPYGRGNSRSVPVETVIEQIKILVDQGYNEVVLTGVDITAYGMDFSLKPTLGFLVKSILNEVPKLERLRISSIDAVEVDDDLWDLIAHEPRLLPHMHLSLQAGDNLILKRMKRRHLRDHAIAFCEKAKQLRPNITFGADLIAGFPTETDEHFENTLRIVDDCNLTFLHVFPYSARPGTPAARMPQVPKDIIKSRAAMLREKGEKALQKFFSDSVSTQTLMLIEEIDTHFIKGKTDTFAPVWVPLNNNQVKVGQVLSVRIEAFTEKNLMAGIV